jgi:hypothetical protein
VFVHQETLGKGFRVAGSIVRNNIENKGKVKKNRLWPRSNGFKDPGGNYLDAHIILIDETKMFVSTTTLITFWLLVPEWSAECLWR